MTVLAVFGRPWPADAGVPTWQGDGAAVRVAGGWRLHVADDVVVAADASLCYLDELCAALRAAGGEPPLRDDAAALVAAAWRAWGDDAAARLEGDFAFVAWDRRARRALAARDHGGSRSLLHAALGDGLAVGSRLRELAALDGVDRTLHRPALLESLIGTGGTVLDETAFTGVRRLPAAHRLEWTAGRAARTARWWSPPIFERDTRQSFADGARELREVLLRAVAERLPAAGGGAVWMSGGYDSTALFALANVAAASRGVAPPVPVSMSYPVGDRGREDELIGLVAARWGAEVAWVDSGAIPPFPDVASWVGERDEPDAHPYERWNGALAARTAALGVRIALNGNGGDQLFGVSPAFLADLAARGRLLAAWREYRSLGGEGAGAFANWATVPRLGRRGRAWLGRLTRRGPLRHHLQPVVPGWIRADALAAAGYPDRVFEPSLRRPGETIGSAETAWYFTGAFGPRVIALASGIARAAGLEARSPMYDRRVIAFAARRPRTDRCHAGEKKRLLRAALEGLLPAEVLARRPQRTGLPGGYLQRALSEALPRFMEATGGTLRIAELGLVEPARLRAAAARFAADPAAHAHLAGGLFDAMAVEHWLRAQAARGANGATPLAA